MKFIAPCISRRYAILEQPRHNNTQFHVHGAAGDLTVIDRLLTLVITRVSTELESLATDIQLNFQ